jgi:hypothetical protein
MTWDQLQTTFTLDPVWTFWREKSLAPPPTRPGQKDKNRIAHSPRHYTNCTVPALGSWKNIKMDLEETEWQGVDLVRWPEGRDKRRAVVNTVMNRRTAENAGDLTSRGTKHFKNCASQRGLVAAVTSCHYLRNPLAQKSHQRQKDSLRGRTLTVVCCT